MLLTKADLEEAVRNSHIHLFIIEYKSKEKSSPAGLSMETCVDYPNTLDTIVEMCKYDRDVSLIRRAWSVDGGVERVSSIIAYNRDYHNLSDSQSRVEVEMDGKKQYGLIKYEKGFVQSGDNTDNIIERLIGADFYIYSLETDDGESVILLGDVTVTKLSSTPLQ